MLSMTFQGGRRRIVRSFLLGCCDRYEEKSGRRLHGLRASPQLCNDDVIIPIVLDVLSTLSNRGSPPGNQEKTSATQQAPSSSD